LADLVNTFNSSSVLNSPENPSLVSSSKMRDLIARKAVSLTLSLANIADLISPSIRCFKAISFSFALYHYNKVKIPFFGTEMTKLSVNINKIATIRNARGANNPNVVQVAKDCERFGAQGITVHPRPDERHIRYQDVMDLAQVVRTEFNIEGYPDARFMELIRTVKPAQATLVPDPPTAITSNTGWDTIRHQAMLRDIVAELHEMGTRVSIFINPEAKYFEPAKGTGTDRVELYTEPYASGYHLDREKAVQPYVEVAKLATELGLGINAGHDLDLHNLAYLKQHIPQLEEVSIGHALICDALYYGLENTIQMYRRQLEL
jgi:pyridoxine 5-phosphate synthase